MSSQPAVKTSTNAPRQTPQEGGGRPVVKIAAVVVLAVLVVGFFIFDFSPEVVEVTKIVEL